jgi:hypothetical protein
MTTDKKPFLSQNQALKVARKHLAQAIRIFSVTEILPANCRAYNAPKNCWYVLCSSETIMLGPSRLICIDKVTGKIVYDSPAGDEG